MNPDWKQIPQPIRRMDPLVEPVSPVQRLYSAGYRVRRAVVESYRGPQVNPDEAMLPMPPHKKVLDYGKMLQNFQQRLDMPGLWQRALRLLKRRHIW